MRRPRDRYRHRQVGLVVLLTALRVLALLVAVELSGLMHAALDLGASLSGQQHVEDDCDDGEAGHECPPGCPNCHVGHAALVAPASIPQPSPTRGASSAPDVTKFIYAETRVPTHPDLGSLYRPPRSRRPSI